MLDAIQAEWAATFADDNSQYPLNLDLRPVWEIVQNIDEEKGDALKEVLLAKWADETARWSPKYLLPGLAPACTDPAAKNYNDLVVPGVPSEVTGCEDCCEYRACTNPRAENYFGDRRPHTVTDDGNCRPRCRMDYCRDHDGADNNCITGSRSDMLCSSGYRADLRYTHTNSVTGWLTFQDFDEYHFRCCSF